MTVGSENPVNRLIDDKKVADQGETFDVTDRPREQSANRFFADHGRIEKLVQIFATEGVEAALEQLDGTPEEDDEAHRAALRALDDDFECDKE
jgi:hypothetical protein